MADHLQLTFWTKPVQEVMCDDSSCGNVGDLCGGVVDWFGDRANCPDTRPAHSTLAFGHNAEGAA
jgi:hypothetical protein